MSDWNVWKAAFDHVTLRADGDPLEIRASAIHGLDKHFPNYETFWRYHIVPATNRPANLDLRIEADTSIGRIGTLSHSLFNDLVNAADSLAIIKGGDLGGERFRHCTDAINNDGNAIQKFTELQKSIEGPLSVALGRQLKLWQPADWSNRWYPSREKIIGYRNFLTHEGQPFVMQVLQTDGSFVPFVLHQDYIVRGNHLTWAEQEAIYRTNPKKWVKLTDVCEELHQNSIAWLNDVYGEIIKTLQPHLIDDDYHWLWGWDTTKRGRHILKHTASTGITLPIGSGSGVSTASPYKQVASSATPHPPIGSGTGVAGS